MDTQTQTADVTRVSTRLEHTFWEVQAKLRKQNITQQQAADHIGICKSSYIHRLNDFGKFRISEFHKLCELVNVQL